MAANPFFKMVTADPNEWRKLSDTPLVLAAKVLIWNTGTPLSDLQLRCDGSDPVNLPKNKEFTLEGVDLSRIEVKGEATYRVTVIGYTR